MSYRSRFYTLFSGPKIRVHYNPGESPRIITDNGPQFISKDFKQYVRTCGMTHVRTSPYYPQSNGKLERYHRTIKSECIRPGSPLTLADARRIVGKFVTDYNEVRLHSAIGYVTPMDKLHGREDAIFAARDRKLEGARQRRAEQRQRERAQRTSSPMTPSWHACDNDALGTVPVST